MIWFKKADDYVDKLENLVDPRGRELASIHRLEIGEIFPLCSQMNYEIFVNDQHLLIDDIPYDERNDMRVRYDKMMTAAAVVSYELSQRYSVQFPKPLPEQVVNVEKHIIGELKKQKFRARRVGFQEGYELMGNIFSENLRILPENINAGRIEIDINKMYVEILKEGV